MNPLHFDPDRRGMPVAEWPEPDRALWQAALVAGELLDEGGVRARYAPETNYKLAKNYGRWLTWALPASAARRARPACRSA